MADPLLVVVTASRFYGRPSVIERVFSVLDAEHEGQVILRHGQCDPRVRAGRRDRIYWAEAEKLPPELQRNLLGGDWHAHLLAEKLGWQIEAVPADWDKHGKAAGHIRSATMVTPAVGLCLAFFASAETNSGTIGCASKAVRANIATLCYCDMCTAPQLGPCGDHCSPTVILAWHAAIRRRQPRPVQQQLVLGEE